MDFNSLEANLNLQTWVIVLEFFGIGVPQQPSASQPSSPNPLSPQPHELSDTVNEEQQDTQMEGNLLFQRCSVVIDTFRLS